MSRDIDQNSFMRKLLPALRPEPAIHRSANTADFVVLIPFVLTSSSTEIAYEKRAPGIRQPDEICFPGGRLEATIDESIEAAAIRETVEELGVPRDAVRVLGRLDAMLTHWGRIIHVAVGTIEEAAYRAAHPNPNEVSRLFTVSVTDLLAKPAERYALRVEVQPEYVDHAGVHHVLFPARELGLPERYWKPWQASAHDIYVYRFSGETIWGITAELTHRVVEILNGDASEA